MKPISPFPFFVLWPRNWSNLAVARPDDAKLSGLERFYSLSDGSHLIRMRNLRGWHFYFGAQKTSIRLAKANLIPWVFSDYDWLYCTCFQMGLNPFFRFYVVIPSLRRYFCRLILRIGFLSFHWNASCHHGSQIWRRKCIAHKPEIERDFFPWKVRSVTVITRDE